MMRMRMRDLLERHLGLAVMAWLYRRLEERMNNNNNSANLLLLALHQNVQWETSHAGL